jgi:hypothetical protein
MLILIALGSQAKFEAQKLRRVMQCIVQQEGAAFPIVRFVNGREELILPGMSASFFFFFFFFCFLSYCFVLFVFRDVCSCLQSSSRARLWVSVAAFGTSCRSSWPGL